MGFKTYSENDIYQKAISEQWSGKGTSEDPFIIESSHSFPHQTLLKDSALFILVKNCTFKYLALKRCKHVRFEGCVFAVLQLLKCSEIIITNCTFKMRLDLITSHDSYIRDSLIPFLRFGKSYKNHFKACTITQIANHFSRANIFEDINTPMQDFNNIMSETPYKYYLRHIGFIGGGVISLISAFSLSFNSYSDLIYWSLIPGLFVMAFVFFVSATAIFYDYKKMARYPDNQIKEKI